MSQIRVNNLTFGYEGSFDNVFENVSFSIDTNWKLGFVGRNGKGKTTFLNLLLGKYEYKGTIDTNVMFDYFPYVISESMMKQSAAEFAEDIKSNCEIWRVLRELDELNEDAEIMYRPFETLSPGERTKVMLAILFSGENDFLLVDEPTNHLDVEAREIVKTYLSRKKGFILVSHDRELLDACVDHILVLNRATIEVCNGNFSEWWENKNKKDSFNKAENEKHLKEITKLKKAAEQTARWADKSERSKIGFDPIKEHDRSISTRSYIGAKTKKMQSRVKQMEHRIDAEIREKEGLLVDLEEPVDLKLFPLSHHKKVLVNVQNLKLGYPDSKSPVIDNLSFQIKEGDRIALHGSNGCGKSTLIKALLKKAGVPNTAFPELIESGVFETASGLIISYVNQDTSGLKGTISEFCSSNNLDESLFCALLRQLDMERAQFEKRIETFSEGQKKKILLSASLMKQAHIYVWDEPLNYIDVFSRMQIENLLLKYQPTMLFVEHDSKFRDKISTETIDLGNG